MATMHIAERIREGMTVWDTNDEKLGKVTRIHASGFEIEKGFFFRTEREASFDDVIDVRGDEIRLACTAAELERRGEAERLRPIAAEPAAGIAPPHAGEEARIPLVEEEVIAHKEEREAGEVRVTKTVVTEEKQVTVPVQREVVRVERVPASGEPTSAIGAFQEETVTIPVREEVVELEKQPVVREEVVITKQTREGTETASTTARREEIDVKAEGDLKEREVPIDEEEEKPRLRKAG